jgi:antitoxin component YwqK of YwqJK toxin-antitoxin module
MWYENGQKAAKINYRDGKPDGLVVGWHENGQKAREANFKDGKEISSKLWNSKGEPVDSEEEARK